MFKFFGKHPIIIGLIILGIIGSVSCGGATKTSTKAKVESSRSNLIKLDSNTKNVVSSLGENASEFSNQLNIKACSDAFLNIVNRSGDYIRSKYGSGNFDLSFLPSNVYKTALRKKLGQSY